MSSQCYIPRFSLKAFLVLQKKILSVFHIWAWRPSYLTNRDLFLQIFNSPLTEGSAWSLTKTGVQTCGRTTDRRTGSDDNSSVWAFDPGELKTQNAISVLFFFKSEIWQNVLKLHSYYLAGLRFLQKQSTRIRTNVAHWINIILPKYSSVVLLEFEPTPCKLWKMQRRRLALQRPSSFPTEYYLLCIILCIISNQSR